MPKTFVMEGIGGVYNYGCEAIVRSTMKMLRDAYPACVVKLVTPAVDYDSKALADLDIVLIPFRRRLGFYGAVRRLFRLVGLPSHRVLYVSPKAFRGADCVLSTSGDLYTPHVSGLPWLMLELERCLLRKGMPLVLWGATIGPFPEGSAEHKALSEHLRRVTLITARETLTLEYAKQVGAGDRAVLVADPAFALDPEPMEVSGYLPRERGNAVVAINISPLINTRLVRLGKGSAEDMAGQCVRAVLEHLPVSVALVPHVVGGPPWDDDHQMLQKVACRLEAYRDRLSLLPPALGVRRTKYFLGQCDAVLAARMHCAIGAMSMCVPTICVSYSMKSLGVLRGVYGDDRWVILLKDLSPQLVVDRLRALLAERSDIVRHLKETVPVLRDRARLAGLELKRRLG